MFTIPTLVTLTAPTCAGKNFLLEEMVKVGFNRIVSTTDRAPRDGEVEGVHYYFISTEWSKNMEQAGEFAELITYNGTRYGVTKAEMEGKMADLSRPPIVILEPNGIKEYQKYCGAHGYSLFNIYVETTESVRLERLVARTTSEIVRARVIDDHHVAKIVATNNKRLKAILEEERFWSHTNRWDVYASGTDTKKALEQIAQGIKSRNSRSDIYK